MAQPLSARVAHRLGLAASKLGTKNPMAMMQRLIDDTFALPEDDPRYGDNALLPGAAPLEPSFGGPGQLQFDIEPLGPGASPGDRRNAATSEMRRLVHGMFGREALHWFDRQSEPWRGLGSSASLRYGAFFGSSVDEDGLCSSRVTYETTPGQVEQLPPGLFRIVSAVLMAMPALRPVFTTLAAQRGLGLQRLTFFCPQAVKIADMKPLLETLGLGHRLPSILQVLGLALGGRFELPARSTLMAFGQSPEGPELELHVMLDMVPDLPPQFLELLTLGLSERPRELTALERWMDAFTPESDVWPGRFSMLSVRTTPTLAPKVSLALRPIEFEVSREALEQRLPGVPSVRGTLAVPPAVQQAH
jgi:hypothetical protein